MLEHIVMWQMNDDLENVEIIKNLIKERVEALDGVVPDGRKIEVMKDMAETSTHDIAIFVHVEDEKALERYLRHEAHVEVSEKFIKPYTKNRVCIDFKIKPSGNRFYNQ